MYLLDTNTCIYFLKDSYPKLTRKLLRMDPKKLAISSITTFELAYGAYKSRWQEQTMQKLAAFLAPIKVIPFDGDDAIAAGSIRSHLEKKGTPIGPYDVLIAGQAAAKNMTVLTHNTKEFSRVPNLKVEDWVK